MHRRQAPLSWAENQLMSTLILVDRTPVVTLPPIVSSMLFPAMQNDGPATYHIGTWWANGQLKKRMSAQEILKQLTGQPSVINDCLRYRDLMAMQNSGLDFFRKILPPGATTISAFASVARDKHNFCYVPYLIEDEKGKLVIRWMDDQIKMWDKTRPVNMFTPG